MMFVLIKLGFNFSCSYLLVSDYCLLVFVSIYVCLRLLVCLCLFLSVLSASVLHQWCALFYRLLHSSTRHIEKVEGGERDTRLVHVNEATAA
jgi:hypothetical protein